MEAVNKERLYTIQGIELISFSIAPKYLAGQSKKTVEFKVGQEAKINETKRLVLIFTKVALKEPEKNISLASLELVCGFKVPVFDRLLTKDKDGNYLISAELNTDLLKISLATSRGVLYSQLRGSYLQDITLPLLPAE